MSKISGKQLKDNSLDLEKLKGGSKILSSDATLGSNKTVEEITSPNEFTTRDFVTTTINNSIDSAATTAGAGLSKTGNVLSVNVDGSTLEIVGDTLQVAENGINETQIDFGSGASQVDATSLPLDTGGTYSGTALNTQDAIEELDTNKLDKTTATAQTVVSEVTFDSAVKTSKLINEITDAKEFVPLELLEAYSSGLDPKGSVLLATNIDLTANTTYTENSSGAGYQDTLVFTGTISASDIDTGATSGNVNFVVGETRILVKNQSDATQNGIYLLTAADTLTRSGDQDASPSNEVSAGNYTFVEQGTYANGGFTLTGSGILTLNADELNWVQFSGAGSITAGAGLTKSANEISVGQGSGLTVNSDSIDLGGTLTSSSFIDGASTHGFELQDVTSFANYSDSVEGSYIELYAESYSELYAFGNNGTVDETIVSLRSHSGDLGTSKVEISARDGFSEAATFYITDNTGGFYNDVTTNLDGIKYTGFGEASGTDGTGANYSTLVDTSLVPKKYVDDAITAGTVEPAGNSTEIQYNDGVGGFGASSNFTFDSVNSALTIGTRNGTVGTRSFAHGVGVTSSSTNSFAIGNYTTASNYNSFASGNSSTASGNNSFAIGNNSTASGSNSFAGGTSTASGGSSFAIGTSAEASGVISFASGDNTIASGRGSQAHGYYTVASGDYSHASGTGVFGFKIYSEGVVSFNHSSNNYSQTAGHGALADQSAILGGLNHNIPATSPRSVILGGDTIKARANDPDQVYVPNLNIDSVPTASTSGDASDNILVRNTSTGAIESVSLNTISPEVTVSNGLNNTSGDIQLGGSLTKNTIINTTELNKLTFDGYPIEYAGNYSTSFTNRSLVDKEYVDIESRIEQDEKANLFFKKPNIDLNSLTTGPGTLTLTNGSSTVTGTGTQFNTDTGNPLDVFNNFELFVRVDGIFYLVSVNSITNDTSFEIFRVYTDYYNTPVDTSGNWNLPTQTNIEYYYNEPGILDTNGIAFLNETTILDNTDNDLNYTFGYSNQYDGVNNVRVFGDKNNINLSSESTIIGKENKVADISNNYTLGENNFIYRSNIFGNFNQGQGNNSFIVGNNNTTREFRSYVFGESSENFGFESMALGSDVVVGHEPLAAVNPGTNGFGSLTLAVNGDFTDRFNYTTESAYIYYKKTSEKLELSDRWYRYSNNAYTTTYDGGSNTTTINFSATQNLPVDADLNTLEVKAESSGKWSTVLGAGRLGRNLRATGLGSHNIGHADSAGSDPDRGADGLFNIVLGGRNSGTPKSASNVAVIAMNNFLADDAVNNTVYLPSVRIGRGDGNVATGSTSDEVLTIDATTGEIKKVAQNTVGSEFILNNGSGTTIENQGTAGFAVNLGGALTQNTEIDTTGQSFRFRINNSFTSYLLMNDSGTRAQYSDNAGTTVSEISALTSGIDNPTSILGITDFTSGTNYSRIILDKNKMEIIDSLNSKGIEYNDDYSVNFTNRSLVDKGYVDSLVTNSTVEPAGSITEIQFNNGTNGFGASSNFTFDTDMLSVPNIELSNAPTASTSGNASDNILVRNITTGAIEKVALDDILNTTTASNGLTSVSGDIQLGGTLSSDVNIITNNNNLSIGSYTSTSSSNSIALNRSTISSGGASLAVNFSTTASGYGSFASGGYSFATSSFSFASGTSTSSTGTASFSSGSNTTASGDASFTMGYGSEASGYNSFAGGKGLGSKTILSNGDASFNHSTNDNSQTTGHGALANQSVILGGINHNIPATSPRSVILGGNAIKARAGEADQVYVPNLNIDSAPTASTSGDASDNILVRNTTTGQVETTTISAISPEVTASNGLTSISGDIQLGGTLTQNTSIDGTFNLSLGTSASRINQFEVNTNENFVVVSAEDNGSGNAGLYMEYNSTGGDNNNHWIDVNSSGIGLNTSSSVAEFNNSINLDTNGISINLGGTSNMSYNADYSANFVDRSLVDKGYVDTQVDLALSGLDFQADVLAIQVDNTLDPGATPTTGDRYIITDSGNLNANFGTITGVANNDIVEYDGADFVVAYDVSVAGEGAVTWDRNTDTFQKYDGTSWSEFGGLAGVTAGNGLTKSGNTINVGSGSGLTVNADSIDLGGTLTANVEIDGNFNVRIGENVNVSSFGVFTQFSGSLDFASGYPTLMGQDGSAIRPGNSGIEIDVSGSNPGAYYAGDYEANFTARSLVSKQYVDNAIQTSSIELNDGLGTTVVPTAGTSGFSINLGGSFDENITLDSKTNGAANDFKVITGYAESTNSLTSEFTIGSSNMNYFIQNIPLNQSTFNPENSAATDLSTFAGSFSVSTYFDAAGSDLSALDIADKVVGITMDSNQGLRYDDDYSANFINESLVSKRYVDTTILNNAVEPAGSITEIQYNDGTNGLGASPSFTFDSAKASLSMGYNATQSSYSASALGSYVTASGYASFASGQRTTASGESSQSSGSFTVASGLASFASGNGDTNAYITSSGEASFNFSKNTNSQIDGHGALADGTAILGGQDHNIPSDSPRSVILGGDAIKARSGEADQVYVPNLNINSVPTASTSGDASDNILVRNTSTGQVETTSLSAISPEVTVSNGLNSTSGDIQLGGALTKDTKISTGSYGFSIGHTDTTATGDHSMAFGRKAIASGLNSMAFGYYSYSSGISSLSTGYGTASGDNSVAMITGTASGLSSFASGAGVTAFGRSSVAINENTYSGGRASFVGGLGTNSDDVISSGRASFNFSENNVSQTTGHGALSDQSVILGGLNHNIPATSPRSVILGGDTIKARANDSDQVYVPNLNIDSTPTASTSGDAGDNILVRNTTTGAIESVSLSAISTDTTASNGLTSVGDDIQLGGTLTQNTVIDINSQELLINNESDTGEIELRYGSTAGASSNPAYIKMFNIDDKGDPRSTVEIGNTGNSLFINDRDFYFDVTQQLTSKTGVTYVGFGESNESGANADYSELVGTSLVPKKYVDDELRLKPNSWETLKQTGFGVSGTAGTSGVGNVEYLGTFNFVDVGDQIGQESPAQVYVNGLRVRVPEEAYFDTVGRSIPSEGNSTLFFNIDELGYEIDDTDDIQVTYLTYSNLPGVGSV